MINRQRLLNTFLELVRIDSPSGAEQDTVRYCVSHLQRLGFATEVDAIGNTIGRLPGQGAPFLVNAHLDSVQPCLGIKPVVEGDFVRSDGTTVLGADDRAAVAAILEVTQVLVENGLRHLPLEVLFTVQEDQGLAGARALDYGRLTATAGVALDHEGPAGGIVVAAPYKDRIRAIVHGRAAHAGNAPEAGISAIRVAAEAIAAMPLGRIDDETTANIGVIHGGAGTNVVPEQVVTEGEARSRDEAKLQAQTAAMVNAFHQAAARHGAKAEVAVSRSYDGFRVGEDNPTVQRLMAAMRAAGIEPRLEASGGGSDVNIFRAHGIDALAISVGCRDAHTTNETQSIPDMVKCAEVLLKAVTL